MSSEQRIGKHASKTIELLLETVFSIRSVHSGYKEDSRGDSVQLKVERPAVKKIVNLRDIRPDSNDVNAGS
jgi:hypothetical protein